MSDTFKALVINQEGENFTREIKSIDKSFLKHGDVLVKVDYSCLNFKDALILKNGARLVKEFPHIPGIDFSGTVVESLNDKFKKGDEINIEKSLRVGDEISGHFVFGHVDDTSKLISIKKVGDSHEIKLEISKKIKKFIAKKGSVSLNGISLTVNQVKKNFMIINIIPFTWLNTNLKGLKIGDRINLEVDMLARYVTQNQ